jgi:hypothetical protein
MAKEKEVCNAHEVFLTMFSEIKASQSELYSLDREKADRLSDIRVSVSELESATKAGLLRIEERQTSYNEDVSKSIKDLSILVSKIQVRKRWTPKAIIAIVSSIFGSGGIGYAIAINIMGRIQ